MAAQNPFGDFNFLLEIDGVPAAGFGEVSGIGATVDPIDYHAGDDPPGAGRIAGPGKSVAVTLKRGMADPAVFGPWFGTAAAGGPPPETECRTVTIRFRNAASADAAAWELRRAWVRGILHAGGNAPGSAAAIETLELCAVSVELLP